MKNLINQFLPSILNSAAFAAGTANGIFLALHYYWLCIIPIIIAALLGTFAKNYQINKLS